MSDPYSVLGITWEATDDEVKKAYRAMCRKYHPDKNPGNQAASDMFLIVQEAYEQIMNSRKASNGTYSYYGQNANNAYGTAPNRENSNANQYANNTNTTEEMEYMQEALEYINSGYFDRALSILERVRTHSAYWFYLSSLANAGTGNLYVALEQARTASMYDPGNMNYSELVKYLENNMAQYKSRRQTYGQPGYSSPNYCGQLLCMNILCNACCDCDPCLCC